MSIRYDKYENQVCEGSLDEVRITKLTDEQRQNPPWFSSTTGKIKDSAQVPWFSLNRYNWVDTNCKPFNALLNVNSLAGCAKECTKDYACQAFSWGGDCGGTYFPPLKVYKDGKQYKTSWITNKGLGTESDDQTRCLLFHGGRRGGGRDDPGLSDCNLTSRSGINTYVKQDIRWNRESDILKGNPIKRGMIQVGEQISSGTQDTWYDPKEVFGHLDTASMRNSLVSNQNTIVNRYKNTGFRGQHIKALQDCSENDACNHVVDTGTHFELYKKATEQNRNIVHGSSWTKRYHNCNIVWTTKKNKQCACNNDGQCFRKGNSSTPTSDFTFAGLSHEIGVIGKTYEKDNTNKRGRFYIPTTLADCERTFETYQKLLPAAEAAKSQWGGAGSAKHGCYFTKSDGIETLYFSDTGTLEQKLELLDGRVGYFNDMTATTEEQCQATATALGKVWGGAVSRPAEIKRTRSHPTDYGENVTVEQVRMYSGCGINQTSVKGTTPCGKTTEEYTELCSSACKELNSVEGTDGKRHYVTGFFVSPHHYHKGRCFCSVADNPVTRWTTTGSAVYYDYTGFPASAPGCYVNASDDNVYFGNYGDLADKIDDSFSGGLWRLPGVEMVCVDHRGDTDFQPKRTKSFPTDWRKNAKGDGTELRMYAGCNKKESAVKGTTPCGKTPKEYIAMCANACNELNSVDKTNGGKIKITGSLVHPKGSMAGRCYCSVASLPVTQWTSSDPYDYFEVKQDVVRNKSIGDFSCVGINAADNGSCRDKSYANCKSDAKCVSQFEKEECGGFAITHSDDVASNRYSEHKHVKYTGYCPSMYSTCVGKQSSYDDHCSTKSLDRPIHLDGTPKCFVQDTDTLLDQYKTKATCQTNKGRWGFPLSDCEKDVKCEEKDRLNLLHPENSNNHTFSQTCDPNSPPKDCTLQGWNAESRVACRSDPDVDPCAGGKCTDKKFGFGTETGKHVKYTFEKKDTNTDEPKPCDPTTANPCSEGFSCHSVEEIQSYDTKTDKTCDPDKEYNPTSGTCVLLDLGSNQHGQTIEVLKPGSGNRTVEKITYSTYKNGPIQSFKIPYEETEKSGKCSVEPDDNTTRALCESNSGTWTLCGRYKGVWEWQGMTFECSLDPKTEYDTQTKCNAAKGRWDSFGTCNRLTPDPTEQKFYCFAGKMCGGGLQKQTRNFTPAENGGRNCPPNELVRYKTCNTHRCRPKVICPYTWSNVWSSHESKEAFDKFKQEEGNAWGDWEKKSYSKWEDSDSTNAYRQKGTYPLENNEPDESAINAHFTCVQDKKCTKECGGGKQYTYSDVEYNDRAAWDNCPVRKTQQCYGSDTCPVDCQVDPGVWTTCTRKCGRGSRSKDVRITEHPQSGYRCGKSAPGKPCKIGSQLKYTADQNMYRATEVCNAYACPPQKQELRTKAELAYDTSFFTSGCTVDGETFTDIFGKDVVIDPDLEDSTGTVIKDNRKSNPSEHYRFNDSVIPNNSGAPTNYQINHCAQKCRELNETGLRQDFCLNISLPNNILKGFVVKNDGTCRCSNQRVPPSSSSSCEKGTTTDNGRRYNFHVDCKKEKEITCEATEKLSNQPYEQIETACCIEKTCEDFVCSGIWTSSGQQGNTQDDCCVKKTCAHSDVFCDETEILKDNAASTDQSGDGNTCCRKRTCGSDVKENAALWGETDPTASYCPTKKTNAYKYIDNKNDDTEGYLISDCFELKRCNCDPAKEEVPTGREFVDPLYPENSKKNCCTPKGEFELPEHPKFIEENNIFEGYIHNSEEKALSEGGKLWHENNNQFVRFKEKNTKKCTGDPKKDATGISKEDNRDRCAKACAIDGARGFSSSQEKCACLATYNNCTDESGWNTYEFTENVQVDCDLCYDSTKICSAEFDCTKCPPSTEGKSVDSSEWENCKDSLWRTGYFKHHTCGDVSACKAKCTDDRFTTSPSCETKATWLDQEHFRVNKDLTGASADKCCERMTCEHFLKVETTFGCGDGKRPNGATYGYTNEMCCKSKEAWDVSSHVKDVKGVDYIVETYTKGGEEVDCSQGIKCHDRFSCQNLGDGKNRCYKITNLAGNPCMVWSDVEQQSNPHKNEDDQICRNDKSRIRPWCYTKQHAWQYC